MKKYINIFIVILILISNIRLCSFSAGPLWLENYALNGREMPFRPYDKSVSQQNPPDFSWQYIKDAVYDLKIASDEGMNEIKYSCEGINTNYYNFSYPFETGIYYWSVRYRTPEGASVWTSPKRFQIAENAVEFCVPSVSELKSRVYSYHPRMFFTNETKSDFIKEFESEEGRKYLCRIEREVSLSRISEEYKEPDLSDYENLDEQFDEVRVKTVSRLLSDMNKSALLYIIHNDNSYAEYAKKLLLNISSWSTDGITSYEKDDMTCRDILLNCSICYDWIYEFLNTAEKETVLNMMKKRGGQIYFDLVASERDTCICISPYNSHGITAMSYLASASVALLGELEEAGRWFENTVPLLINILPVWGNEDGGFSQGTYYYHAGDNKTFVDIFRDNGIIDVGKKPWYSNEYLFPLYMYPKNSYGAFGDYSYIKSTDNMKYILGRYASVYGSAESLWAAEAEGNSGEFYDLCEGGFALRGMLLAKNKKELDSVPPVNYEKAKLFKDVGMAAMHSDLIDENRISMYFKSGPFGSYNHSHADQNTFVIEAFGERLAIDSGYYAYGTDWENLYVRQTYAHNGITFGDGCYGQTINNIKAKGNIEEFITTENFDILSGDATGAYSGPSHMKRKIIYVRPGSYIIIDELKGNTQFQFWLNGMKGSIRNLTNNSVSLVNGVAQLDCKVLYPEVKSDVSYSFTLPDKTEVERPAKYKNSPTQERVCFKTEKVSSTRMVTLINVHKTDETEEMPRIAVNDSYIDIEYKNGVKATVNLEWEKRISIPEGSFEGDAVICHGDSYALLSGKYLEKNGKVLAESTEEMSYYYDGKSVRISTDEDNSLKLCIPGAQTLTDENGVFIGENPAIKLSYKVSDLKLDINRGNYNININSGNEVEGLLRGSFGYSTDGVEETVDGIIKDGVFYGRLNNGEGYYIINEISRGVSLKDAGKGDTVYLEENQPVVIYGPEYSTLSLTGGKKKLYSPGESVISVKVSEGGAVTPVKSIVKNGEKGEFIINPNKGYYVESITFNGYPLFPDKNGKILTLPVKADSVLEAKFALSKKDAQVSLYEEIAYPDENSFVAFGCASDEAEECGIVLSKSPDFTEKEFYPSKVTGEDGRYGVHIKGNGFYVKAYAVYNGKTEFSEKTVYARNEYSALWNYKYEGSGYEYTELLLSGAGKLENGSIIYSNMPYTAEVKADIFADGDYLRLCNPVASSAPQTLKNSWNGELHDYYSFDVYRSGTLYVFTSGDFIPLETYGLRKYKSASENGYIRKFNPQWNVYHDRDMKFVYTMSVDVEKGKKKHISLPNAAWYDMNQWGYFVVFLPY